MTSRRKWLKGSILAGTGILTTGLLNPISSLGSPLHNTKKRSLRIAHITDVHVQPEGDAPFGFASALKTIQNLEDKVDCIVNTGDCIMDSFKADKARTKTQWDLWNSILQNETSLPIISSIGNHDVWGWGYGGKYKNEELFGKDWAVKELKIPKRYYRKDMGNWSFISLDSTFADGLGYKARLDDEQFDWLSKEVEQIPKENFVCILSHMPILGISVFFDGDNMKSNNWHVPGSWMHIDAIRIKNLLHKHSNVKVALSGHIHLIDECEYLGVKYYCDGAVSGAWWGGNNQEFPPAFSVINLYADGSSDREMYYYKWKA